MVRTYDNKVRKLGTNGGEDANMKLQITHENRPRNDRRYRDRREEMQESTTVKNGSVLSVWIVLHGVTTVTHRLHSHAS